MARKVQHSLLQVAKDNKNDEFYTQLYDIEKELQYYEAHFQGRTVFCNCDDVRTSNFYRYFIKNFAKEMTTRTCAFKGNVRISAFSSNVERS